MNIELAKTLAITDICDKLNLKPERSNDHEAFYLSPLREEKTASFHVSKKKNCWYDFGIGKGGNVIDFACAYLASHQENNTVVDALRWLEHMSGNMPRITAVAQPPLTKEIDPPALALKSVEPLGNIALIRYLEGRGIAIPIARLYLKEAAVLNTRTGKTITALAFPNDEEGFELRNPFFKGSVIRKGLSFIRGSSQRHEGLHIFEGQMDFLSVMSRLKATRLKHDVIVLNSLSFLPVATPYIEGCNYDVVYSWLDNDPAGLESQQSLNTYLETERKTKHRPMNVAYKPYKDVNEWHCYTPKLA